MNERELGNALLKGEGPIDLRTLTDGVLRRDRRRMWLAGIACVIAWMMVVMVPWATTLPMLAKIAEHQHEMETNVSRPGDDATLMMQVRQATVATFLCSVATMFLAAVCTVTFIFLTRRVTMRQVSAQLAEISAQLKALGKSK